MKPPAVAIIVLVSPPMPPDNPCTSRRTCPETGLKESFPSMVICTTLGIGGQHFLDLALQVDELCLRDKLILRHVIEVPRRTAIVAANRANRPAGVYPPFPKVWIILA